ncbi:MAG: hypothetical protein ACLTXL_16560, partial [Clostridia bacterium]
AGGILWKKLGGAGYAGGQGIRILCGLLWGGAAGLEDRGHNRRQYHLSSRIARLGSVARYGGGKLPAGDGTSDL